MFPSVPADRLHCVQMVRTLRLSDDISHLDSVSDVMYPPDRTYILPTKKTKVNLPLRQAGKPAVTPASTGALPHSTGGIVELFQGFWALYA